MSEQIIQEILKKSELSTDFLTKDEWKTIVDLLDKVTLKDPSPALMNFLTSYEKANKFFKNNFTLNFYSVEENPLQIIPKTEFSNLTLVPRDKYGLIEIKKEMKRIPIAADIHKTPNYHELLKMGFDDITTPRQLKNGTIKIVMPSKKPKGNPEFEFTLNTGGKLGKTYYTMGGSQINPLKTWAGGLKTPEAWDEAWGWLINWVNLQGQKNQKKEEILKEDIQKIEEFKKNVQIEKIFSQKDFDDVMKVIEHELKEDEMNGSINRDYQDVITEIYKAIFQQTPNVKIYFKAVKLRPKNKKKVINNYFDLIGQNQGVAFKIDLVAKEPFYAYVKNIEIPDISEKNKHLI